MGQVANVNVYFCDSQQKVHAAVTFLKGLGYSDAQITVDEITGIGEYDGARFGAGGKADAPPNANFLVVAKG
jgi:hypothetical protein